MRLCRKESIKNVVCFFGINSRSGVLYHNADCVVAIVLRAHLQYATVTVDRTHGINRVLDQIADDLLQLTTVANDGGNSGLRCVRVTIL